MSYKKFPSPKDVVEIGLNKNHMNDRESYLHLGRGGRFKKAICVTGRCQLLPFNKMKQNFSKGLLPFSSITGGFPLVLFLNLAFRKRGDF